jgi:hypothetical protein
MNLKVSLRYAFAFLLLLIVMMELHELVHIGVGRIICGCWGPRDFNVWALCDGCLQTRSNAWLATFMGPFVSFLLMWLGMYWLSSPNQKMKALGFAFIFSNIPFGRITTVMMGGGDEMVVIRQFLKNDFSRTYLILFGTVLVLIVGLPPIVKAYRVLNNHKAWLYILVFLTAPLLFLLVYTLTGLNTLLSNGFLANSWIMGTPLLITLHTLIALTCLLFCYKNLYRF